MKCMAAATATRESVKKHKLKKVRQPRPWLGGPRTQCLSYLVHLSSTLMAHGFERSSSWKGALNHSFGLLQEQEKHHNCMFTLLSPSVSLALSLSLSLYQSVKTTPWHDRVLQIQFVGPFVGHQGASSICRIGMSSCSKWFNIHKLNIHDSGLSHLEEETLTNSIRFMNLDYRAFPAKLYTRKNHCQTRRLRKALSSAWVLFFT